LTRLLEAVRANPYIATATLSGAVAIAAAVGVIDSTAAALAQGALSILLGVSLAVSAVTTRAAIRRHAAIRRATHERSLP
jgi:hypothetical protein